VALFLAVVLDPVAVTIALGTLGAGRSRADRTILAASATATALVGLGLAALVGETVLDALDISVPAAQLGAGVVVGVLALDTLWGGPGDRVRAVPGPAWRLGLFPLGVPALVSPASVTATIAWAGAEGRGTAIGAVLLAVVVTMAVAHGIVTARRDRPVNERVARIAGAFVGAAMAVIAFDLVRDGVFGT
jgi:small neutral amino acid transporter SnatA (MarC family)